MRELTDDSPQPSSPAPRRRTDGRPRAWRLRESPGRYSALADPWESEDEQYPAAMVLQDLDLAGDDLAATTAVLARFAALQLVLLAEAGLIEGGHLAQDRIAALSYLSDPAAFRPGEWQALDSVLRLTSRTPTPALADALITAGTAAAAWGHDAGARACCRAAYRIALARGWTAEAAAAARAVANLALAAGIRRSVALWRRRATLLDRRLTEGS